MMRIFILVLVVGFLRACHNFSSDNQLKVQESPTMSFNEQALSKFSWQLIEATDAYSQRIDTLFLASKPDQPITLKFAAKTLYIDHLFCNINSIGIHFEGNRLHTKNPIIATMMGCPEDIALRESTMIREILLNNPTFYLQSYEGQIQLIIETPRKDKLIFKGIHINN